MRKIREVQRLRYDLGLLQHETARYCQRVNGKPSPLVWVLFDGQIFPPVHLESSYLQMLSAGRDDGHKHSLHINRVAAEHLLGDQAKSVSSSMAAPLLALPLLNSSFSSSGMLIS